VPPQPTNRRLRIPDDVATLVRGLHPDIKRKVRAALDRILRDPETGNPLRDSLEGLRSARVGRVRVIYRATQASIEIVAIGPRRTIYEETTRRLKAEQP
jgi:mRNA interferase RelE/StbE